MIMCEHCREAISSRGEKFSRQTLNETQLENARIDQDGCQWLICEWCKEEDTVESMEEVEFI